MDINKLVRMANQIAVNFEYGPDNEKAAAATREHMSRFWSPPMREQIIEHFRTSNTELNETAKRAVSELALGKRHVV